MCHTNISIESVICVLYRSVECDGLILRQPASDLCLVLRSKRWRPSKSGGRLFILTRAQALCHSKS